MKLVHLSDLHLGKIVNGFSMVEDQKYILTKILKIIDEEKPDAVLIAGDVYDKSIPSSEAVMMFDGFLNKLVERNLQTFVVSGNHDSVERNAFAAKLIDKSGVHISPVYDGNVKPYTLIDENGPVNIYMLPFIKPVMVRALFPEQKDEIKTYTDAMKVVIQHLDLNKDERNVLVAHQFVTGAERSDSEEKSLGGMDNVDGYVFEDFDYVALGHIHRPQPIGDKMRYAGSPLKYSASEIHFDKSVTIVELGAKGDMQIRTAPLVPRRDMVEIKGTFDELVLKENYEGLERDNYYFVTLTDENDVMDAMIKLRQIYPNIMELKYDNARTRANAEVLENVKVEDLSPSEIFAELYEKQNGRPMDEEAKKYLDEAIAKIWEEE